MRVLSSRPVRRSLVALLLALLTFGAIGAVLSTAGSATMESAAFAIPSPRVGDRVVYEAVDPRAPGLPRLFLDAEWTGPARVLAADGWHHTADAVQASATLFRTPAQVAMAGASHDATPRVNQSYFFRPASHDLLALVTHGTDIWTGQDGIYAQGARLANGTTWTRDAWSTTVFDADAGASCLLANAFQGARLEVGDTVSFRGCSMNGLVELPALTLEAVARGSLMDLPALVFRGSDLDERPRGEVPVAGDVTVWMLDGIPYPAAIDWVGNGTSGSIQLVGFASGEGGLAIAPDRADPLPPLVEAERLLWGVDDSGVDHPWPLSQAFQESLADPAFPELRSFFSDHPDAYVSAVWDASAPGRPQWIIEVTGVDESFAFSVQRGTDPFALGLPDSSWIPVNQYSTSVFGAFGGYRFAREAAPPPGLAPSALPTLRSLLERWEAYAAPWESGGTRPTWSVETRCGDDACSTVTTVVVVGRTVYGCDLVPSGLPKSPGFDWTCDGRTSLLRIASDGTAVDVGSHRIASRFNQELEARPPADKASTWPAGGPAAQPPRIAFSRAEAAATGAAALAVALLYLLWPLAKGASLAGLFSRVGSDEVLDHPTRRRVMDLVSAKPGLHFQALAREAGLANGALLHHLRSLVNAKLVVKEAGPFYTCYFPRGTDAAARREAPVLKSSGANRLLAEVRRRPGVSIQGLADAAGMAQSTVSYHVRRLAEAGLLRVVHHGRATQLHAASQAPAAGPAA